MRFIISYKSTLTKLNFTDTRKHAKQCFPCNLINIIREVKFLFRLNISNTRTQCMYTIFYGNVYVHLFKAPLIL